MQKQYKVPTRQVHLDFHTSPDIPNICGNFSKEDFQAALKAGNLESITVFAKCHHGLCYYPTKDGTTRVRIDYKNSGIGSNSCGPVLLEQYRLGKKELCFQFQMKL